MVLPWQETADALTQQALEAAEQGRWDLVTRCYQERAQLFRNHDISKALARRLYSMDGRVQDRLRMASMSVQHILTDVASKRRLLERLDAEYDVPDSKARRVSRRV